MSYLSITFGVVAMLNVATAIKGVQVIPGAFAKFTWNGKAQRAGLGRERGCGTPSRLNGQIVKIMNPSRSSDGTRINIQSLYNPALKVGVKLHHLEAMELQGLVGRSDLNGLTAIQEGEAIISNEEVPCFRIPVRTISASGKLEGDGFKVKLQNIKYISSKTLNDCSDVLRQRVLSKTIDDDVRDKLVQSLIEQNWCGYRDISNIIGMEEAVKEFIADFYFNEIRSLFHLFVSSKDRDLILGYPSYTRMHRELPSKMQKVHYLQSLQSDGYDFEDSLPIFEFDDDDDSILKINLHIQSEDDRRNGVLAQPQGLNWRAFRGLRKLENLDLTINAFRPEFFIPHEHPFRFSISMDDFDHLPPSLRMMSISGHRWVGHNVNLRELPTDLVFFEANYCMGMDGILNLNAPNSKLEDISFKGNSFRKISGWAPNRHPPNLDLVDLEDIPFLCSKIPDTELDAFYKFDTKKLTLYEYTE